MTSIRSHMRAYNLPKKKTNSNYRIEFNTFSTSHGVAVCVWMCVRVCACAIYWVCVHVLVRIEKLDNRESSSSNSNNDLNDGDDYHEQLANTLTQPQEPSAEHSVQFRREIHARNTKFAACMYGRIIHWSLCHFFVCRLSFSVCFGEVFVSTAFPTC